MNIYNRNVEIFKENRVLSETKYFAETCRMKEGTFFYEDARLSIKEVKNREKEQKISFIKDDTAHAGWESKLNNPTKRVGILNFADALVPGGLVLYGEQTQEEAICRSSNLYESLLLGKDFYYNYNRSLNSQLYSDRLIYSRDVLIFRNNFTGELYENPQYVDVITCPSPSTKLFNKNEFDELLCNRIECIIKSAYANSLDIIVLGAWGCGAFGQSAKDMGVNFAKVLSKYNVFDEVVFAFVSLNNDNNYKDFSDGFKNKYED